MRGNVKSEIVAIIVMQMEVKIMDDDTG